MRNAIVVLALLALAGCSTMQPSDKNELLILSSGDAGALGCSIILTEAKPADIVQAQKAAAAAQTVLDDPSPSIAKLAAAFDGNLPAKYVPLGAALVARIKVRLGESDVLPVDSVAWHAASAFVGACKSALGETA